MTLDELAELLVDIQNRLERLEEWRVDAARDHLPLSTLEEQHRSFVARLHGRGGED